MRTSLFIVVVFLTIIIAFTFHFIDKSTNQVCNNSDEVYLSEKIFPGSMRALETDCHKHDCCQDGSKTSIFSHKELGSFIDLSFNLSIEKDGSVFFQKVLLFDDKETLSITPHAEQIMNGYRINKNAEEIGVYKTEVSKKFPTMEGLSLSDILFGQDDSNVIFINDNNVFNLRIYTDKIEPTYNISESSFNVIIKDCDVINTNSHEVSDGNHFKWNLKDATEISVEFSLNKEDTV